MPRLLDRRPTSALSAATFWLIVCYLLLTAIGLVTVWAGALLAVLQVFLAIAIFTIAGILLVRLIRTRMLWSLRNKLIVTYVLIGLAPVVLFVTLVTIFLYIAAGQFAIHLADTRVQAELNQLSTGTAVRLARVVHILDTESNPTNVETRIEEIAATERAAGTAQRAIHAGRVKAFLDGAPVGEHTANLSHDTPLGLPAWGTELPHGSFRGMVLDADDLYLVAVQQVRLKNGHLFTMLSSVPVDSFFMESVAEGLGRASIFAQTTNRPEDASVQTRRRRSLTTSVSGGMEPAPRSLADIRVRFFSTTAVTDWETGKPDNVPIEVYSRPSVLYLQLFGASLAGVVTSAIRIGLIVLCLLFAMIEALALYLATRLTRTMTASVADLYQATLHVDQGQLQHRIAVTRTDQLAELSRSFNRMTGSLQRLLAEQKEKERLQNELSIAQEVQANLFPTAIRNLPTLELHGICRPARSVSGDYYDFLVFYNESFAGKKRTESGVGIALGDISGKGISAALLMATLHSAVRAYQFASEAASSTAPSAAELFSSPGRIMELLNRHLYRSTQPEKYATLFLAHYDAATAWLTYSTAGQLPPLLLGRDNSLRRLDCGGTVVGLMDGMKYEEGRFPMYSGDILVAYSDGVTEPENDFGDFGEERLMDVVRRHRDQPLHVISREVMQALDAWIGAEEQPDDITLVLARQA